MDMRELMIQLGRVGAVEKTGLFELTITDKTEEGFSRWRNIAKVRARDGKIEVNPFRGYLYKPGEYIEVKDGAEAAALIQKIRKEVRGKDKEGQQVQSEAQAQ